MARLIDSEGFGPDDVKTQRTPVLVQAYADLKVWFASFETNRPHPAGGVRHAQLGAVVLELRSRGVLD